MPKLWNLRICRVLVFFYVCDGFKLLKGSEETAIDEVLVVLNFCHNCEEMNKYNLHL